MKTATLAVVLVLCIGACTALHRIKLFKKNRTYPSVNEHLMNLGAKYGFNVDSNSAALNLPLKNFQNLAYYGSISLGEGSHAKCFQVDFDTGSSNTWVPGTDCTSNACLNHKSFDCKESATCKSSGYSSHLAYGKGEVTGELVYDTLCFGCDGRGPCVKQQGFLVTKTESKAPFYYNQYDGFVGLAYDSLAISGTQTPFSALIANQECPEGVFAFWMNQDQSSQDGGEMTICGTDPNHYTNPLVWTPVTEQKYWQFKADSIKIRDKVMRRNVKAIAGTGTSLIVGPADDILAVYKQLGVEYDYASGVSAIDCRQRKKLPTVTITIGGTEFNLSPQNYLIKDQSSDSCIVGFATLPMADLPGDVWVLGDVFLGPVYTVFDRTNNRLGFSLSTASSGSIPTSSGRPITSTKGITTGDVITSTDRPISSTNHVTGTSTGRPITSTVGVTGTSTGKPITSTIGVTGTSTGKPVTSTIGVTGTSSGRPITSTIGVTGTSTGKPVTGTSTGKAITSTIGVTANTTEHLNATTGHVVITSTIHPHSTTFNTNTTDPISLNATTTHPHTTKKHRRGAGTRAELTIMTSIFALVITVVNLI